MGTKVQISSLATMVWQIQQTKTWPPDLQQAEWSGCTALMRGKGILIPKKTANIPNPSLWELPLLPHHGCIVHRGLTEWIHCWSKGFWCFQLTTDSVFLTTDKCSCFEVGHRQIWSWFCGEKKDRFGGEHWIRNHENNNYTVHHVVCQCNVHPGHSVSPIMSSGQRFCR